MRFLVRVQGKRTRETQKVIYGQAVSNLTKTVHRKENRAEKDGHDGRAQTVCNLYLTLFFQDSISMWVSNRNPLSIWKLPQKGNGGEIPDIVKTGLDQAGRFKPSLSDVVAHYSFLRLHITCDLPANL